MVTDAGTVAAFVFELVRVTLAPNAGAGPVKVTVPTTDDCDPPTRPIGEIETLWTDWGLIVSTSVFETEPSLAPMVEVADAVTPTVVTMKVAEVAPAGIDTVVGTVASFVLLEVNVTVAPPVGAATLRATVPVEDAPPIRVVGAKLRDASFGTATEMSWVRLTPR